MKDKKYHTFAWYCGSLWVYKMKYPIAVPTWNPLEDLFRKIGNNI